MAGFDRSMAGAIGKRLFQWTRRAAQRPERFSILKLILKKRHDAPASAPLWMLLLASGVFGVFIAYTPWAAISGGAFPDLLNYEWYVHALQRGTSFDYRYSSSPLSYLTNEYAWHWLLVRLAETSLSPTQILRLISFFAAFAFFLFTSRRIGLVWAFVLLSNPLVISLLFGQLRSALAAAVFLVVLEFARWRWTVLLHAIAPFIHLSMLAIAPIWAFAALWARKVRMNMAGSLTLLAGGCVAGLIFALASGDFLSALGDRRASGDYDSSGLLYTVFWLLFPGLIAFLAGNRRLGRAETASIAGAVFIIAMAAVATVLGAYGLRFIAMFFPVVAIATRAVDGNMAPIATVSLVSYELLLWVYWVLL